MKKKNPPEHHCCCHRWTKVLRKSHVYIDTCIHRLFNLHSRQFNEFFCILGSLFRPERWRRLVRLLSFLLPEWGRLLHADTIVFLPRTKQKLLLSEGASRGLWESQSLGGNQVCALYFRSDIYSPQVLRKMPTLSEAQFNQECSSRPCKHIAPAVYFTFTISQSIDF